MQQLSLPSRRDESGAETGFTLIELTVVVLIMGILLVAAGSALISLSTATNRDDGLVQEEQAATTAVTQLASDLRSAHTLSIPSGATAADEVLLAVNQSSGATTQVEWIYTPASGSTAGTLKRYAQNSSGSLVASSISVSNVANPSSKPFLTYYNDSGIANATTQNIANCSTSVAIDLVVAASKSAGSGVTTFETTRTVALTDQLAIITQPGSIQCPT